MREKHAETRNKLAEAEAAIQNLQATIKQFELQLNHSKKLCDELLNEKENMKEQARNEIQNELKTIKKERESEIERIYSRYDRKIQSI